MEKTYGPDVLYRLRYLFSGEMRHEKSLTAFRLFMGNFSEHPRAPFVYEMAAKSYTALNDTVAAVKTKEELASKFNPESAWYKKNFPNGDKDIDNLVSGTMLELARHYHSAAKRKRETRSICKRHLWVHALPRLLPGRPCRERNRLPSRGGPVRLKRYL